MNETERRIAEIQGYAGPPLKLMEVCGTHTRSIFEYGIRSLLPPGVTLISGPGCPVCVTPAAYIDHAVQLARQAGTALCTFGDMLRVPGTRESLQEAKATGGDVRVLYSPMDILAWAKSEPQKTFILAAVGFETTLPIYALLAEKLLTGNVTNVRMLTSIKAVLPALEWICATTPDIGGFIGPGHVSAILGSDVYRPLCARYRIPLAVGGFSYELIIAAIHDLIRQQTQGSCEAHNLYPGVVAARGNARALALTARYFSLQKARWRGLGDIDASGYILTGAAAGLDAGLPLEADEPPEPKGCLCGQVITGRVTPDVCPNFGTACTPGAPLGPCMVSTEGACGIWHANQQRL